MAIVGNPDLVSAIIVIFCVALGFFFALYYAFQTAKIIIPTSTSDSSEDHLVDEDNKLAEIMSAISEGANAFLYKEYFFIGWFCLGFGIVVMLAIGGGLSRDNAGGFGDGAMAMVAFWIGAITSVVSGFIGMRIAVFANGRVAKAAVGGVGAAFNVAFKAGSVMGFALVSLGVLMLGITIGLFRFNYADYVTDKDVANLLYEVVAGFGLGGSTVALFARVGGGIYTKAADVGADLVGKVEKGIPEDDPRNPAVIADNVGDNVGDIAGMGADLFGSFAEATCAAQVLTAQSASLGLGDYQRSALAFPLLITATGIVVCFFTTFFSTHIWTVKTKEDVEPALKRQLIVSTLLETPVLVILCYVFLPSGTFQIDAVHQTVKWWHVFFCIASGLWSGLIIGFITEYYTSHSYTPVREVSESCKTGAATNVIFGLALGYKSVIVPVFCIAVTIFIAFSLAGMYGIAMAALGILSTLPVALTIDGFGPISDNAGGVAEMSHMPPEIRDNTDALDAAGNTTAAIGKGFAIGSAAFVGLALFGAFVETTRTKSMNKTTRLVQVLITVDVLEPFVFAGLLIGAMLPYWFSAMTMKSVGQAAYAMVEEVRRQFHEIPGLMEGTAKPDYAACVSIATEAALREMIAPGLLVLLAPLVIGFLFGPTCLAGMLAGSLVSGVQIAISASNTGGAWDNAKKYIEAGGLELKEDPEDMSENPKMRPSKKGDDVHKAAVTGDTVGDPLKDTSGPSLNILIKLMAIISLVFARAFPLVGYIPLWCGATPINV
jgi:inorganic pyrophosphatase